MSTLASTCDHCDVLCSKSAVNENGIKSVKTNVNISSIM